MTMSKSAGPFEACILRSVLAGALISNGEYTRLPECQSSHPNRMMNSRPQLYDPTKSIVYGVAILVPQGCLGRGTKTYRAVAKPL